MNYTTKGYLIGIKHFRSAKADGEEAVDRFEHLVLLGTKDSDGCIIGDCELIKITTDTPVYDILGGEKYVPYTTRVEVECGMRTYDKLVEIGVYANGKKKYERIPTTSFSYLNVSLLV